jgi:hypothetical protein
MVEVVFGDTKTLSCSEETAIGSGSVFDRIFRNGGKDMSKSKSITEALDNIYRAIGADEGNIEFPQLANGSVEKVLVFNSDDKIFLDTDGPIPFFHSTGEGILTDLQGRALPGSKGLSSLPLTNPKELDDAVLWPPIQQHPYNKPPVDPTNTTEIGFAKNFISFGDGSSLATVGPSLAKILLLKGGGAQFWESSVQAICEATGKYEGARGMLVFAGSAFFPAWPPTRPEQIQLLSKGFDARLVRCFKLVLKKDQ